MMINILILLLAVTVIAVVVSIVGNSNKAPQELKTPTVDNHKPDTTERLEESLGTLSDRAKAALQYQRLKNNFEKNCQRDPETAAMVTNKVKHNFDKMARQLATIGTNVNPEDVQTTVSKNGLPPGWELK